MKDAAALVAQGAAHGTVVVAEQQTAGIGRHGHSWHSESAGGLYMSIVLRLSKSSPILTMALGLAVQRAVDDTASVATDLRWPNDVLLNERKLAGIMVQTADDALIAGIGVNVNQRSFPEDLAGIATSLRVETGREHSKDVLLERIAAEAMRHAQLPKPEVLRLFEVHSTYVRGRHVEVAGEIRGVTDGLTSEGFLCVRTGKGVETIVSGGVRAL